MSCHVMPCLLTSAPLEPQGNSLKHVNTHFLLGGSLPYPTQLSISINSMLSPWLSIAISIHISHGQTQKHPPWHVESEPPRDESCAKRPAAKRDFVPPPPVRTCRHRINSQWMDSFPYYLHVCPVKCTNELYGFNIKLCKSTGFKHV